MADNTFKPAHQVIIDRLEALDKVKKSYSGSMDHDATTDEGFRAFVERRIQILSTETQITTLFELLRDIVIPKEAIIDVGNFIEGMEQTTTTEEVMRSLEVRWSEK